MYSLYRELHPPTGIEHSLVCNFFSKKERNLVISGVNQLHVYRFNCEVEVKGQDKFDIKKKQKLELLGRFKLWGNIIDIQSVHLAGSVRDSLLLSFHEAKLALVEYDPSTHDLKTSSLHYFEEYEIKCGFQQQCIFNPYVRVDPLNRCAAMLIYGTRLVILPFRNETADEAESLPSSKSPVLSSYIIDLRTLDEKITNIIDFQFLHGYYEPTIFLLYEPLPTWIGRVAVRKDSCSTLAISLNIPERVHPTIWSQAVLPFDAFKVIAIPKPIGGVLLFCANSLIYMNQSVPPYGVSLNILTDGSTDFLLKTQEGVKISLDAAQACLITPDKLVISLKGGELYVLTIVVDGMRAVRSFHFDKAAASVLTTCMCSLDGGFLYLGSRLGNSLLLKYTEKLSIAFDQPEIEKKDSLDEPANKKKKSDSVAEWMASDIRQLDDLDDLEVYGNEPKSESMAQITSYTFEVCDSILNIGPCGMMVMGEPAFLSEEFSNSVDPDLELVTTSGYGKNGALSVLQRTIRPQVVTTFELPGCTDMWTVIGPPIADQEENTYDGCSHSLLILSTEDSSMILQTGKEIMELDQSGFSTNEPTIFAGNICGDKYVLQVTSHGVRLLQGINQLQHIPMDTGLTIVSCSVADPYLVIMIEEGQVILMSLNHYETGARLQINRSQIHYNSKVLTVCAYKDESEIFTSLYEDDMNPVPVNTETIETSFTTSVPTIEDEDEMLYGESDATTIKKEPTDKVKQPISRPPNLSIEKVYWMAVARQDGSLEIYSIPDFTLYFLVKNFSFGYKVLVDSGQLSDPGKFPDKLQDIPIVKELAIVGLGNKGSRPHLFARVDEELFIYEAFPYPTPSMQFESRLQLHFKKIPHGLILKRRVKRKNENDDGEPGSAKVKWLRPFSDISGYKGVFICGPYPHWIFMSSRGALRVHPMGIDGWISCFAQFHNVNCPKGFLYFNKKGELRISVLPNHLSYDAYWPIRKVALKCTPHFVIYHPDSKTYSVVTSTYEVCNKVVKAIGEGEREIETQERSERFIWPNNKKFAVQLFSPVSWEAIPNTKFEMNDFENVTCMRNVTLASEGTISGMKGYVAMSTTYTWGEEVTTVGRIIIYDVIEVVPEPGQPLTKNKVKIIYDKEQKGPVSAIECVCGFLISAVGQKIYIWTLKDRELSGVAFIDTQIYITSISVVKNLILVGDLCKSVTLYRYQSNMKVLSIVSRDMKPLEVYSTAFVVDNTQLLFLASDRENNFVIFNYNHEIRESQGGQRLMRRADFNIGVQINTFFRVMCKKSDPSTNKSNIGAEYKHVNYFASLDGSIGCLMPVSEKVYRRLLMMQNALCGHIPHYAGLNPKTYRLLQSEKKLLNNPQKNVLDGDLLWKFLHLSLTEKNELTRKIGTTVDQIVDDLLEVDRLSAHF